MKKQGRTIPLILAAALMLVAGDALAKVKRFSSMVGRVNIGTVDANQPLQVPYITWGGDMATFYANGGTKTKSGSIFNRQGLDLRLKAGDDSRTAAGKRVQRHDSHRRATVDVQRIVL